MSKANQLHGHVLTDGRVCRIHSGFAKEAYQMPVGGFTCEQSRLPVNLTAHVGKVVAGVMVIGAGGAADYVLPGIENVTQIAIYGQRHGDRTMGAPFQDLMRVRNRIQVTDLPQGIVHGAASFSSNDPKPTRPLNWICEVYDPNELVRERLYGKSNASPLHSQVSPSAIAQDALLKPKQRYKALLEWLLIDKAVASQFVLAELTSANNEWRDALVHAAMDTWFDNRQQQLDLAGQLLTIAEARGTETDPSSASVTRNAILRAGSLLSSDDLDRLRPFLSRSKTTLATLVAMLRIVANDPASINAKENKLISALTDIVSQYSSPLIHRRGEIGASLKNAMSLLAILAPDKFVAGIDEVKRLNKPHLFKRLRQDLLELKSHPKWQSHSNSTAGRNLVRAIEAINQQIG